MYLKILLQWLYPMIEVMTYKIQPLPLISNPLGTLNLPKR